MFGWWPVELIKNDRFRNIYKLYKQLLNTITYCFLITFFLGLVITVLNDATMKDVFEHASVFLGLTVATVRAWIANSKKGELIMKEIVNFERELFGQPFNSTRECLYNKWVKFLNIVTAFLAVLGISITSLYLIFPILSADSTLGEKPLPFKLWLPFNSQKYYTLAYSFNAVGTVLAVGTAVNADCTTVLFILHGIQRAEILYDIIKHFSSEMVNEDSEDMEMMTLKAVRKLVKKHQSFIK